MSRPLKVVLKSKVPDDAMKHRKGTSIADDDMAVQLCGDADVFTPKGDLLCALRRNAVTPETRAQAIEQFRWMKSRFTTDNRASYTGYSLGGSAGTKFVRNDDKVSRQTRTIDSSGKVVKVSSAIIGYYDRVAGRFPFCCQTAFTKNHPERWDEVVPLVKEVDKLFEKELPHRWKVQREMADTVSKDFRIPGTVFSTLTVNNNVCGTVHKDAGDFKEGFGIIGCFRNEKFTRGELCFPQYKVFVDFKDSDILFFNPHEWHGVRPMIHDDEEEQSGERITVVYYLRKKMCECGSAEEELERAKEQFGGLDGIDEEA